MAQQTKTESSLFESVKTWAPALEGFRGIAAMVGLVGAGFGAGFGALYFYKKKQQNKQKQDKKQYEHDHVIGNKRLRWRKDDCKAIESFTGKKPVVMTGKTTKPLFRFQVIPLPLLKEKQGTTTGELQYPNMNTIPSFPESIRTFDKLIPNTINEFGLDGSQDRVGQKKNIIPIDKTRGISCVSSLVRLAGIKNIFNKNCIWINSSKTRKMHCVGIVSELPIGSTINSKFIGVEDNGNQNPAHVSFVPTVPLTSKDMESIDLGFGNGFTKDCWRPIYALRPNKRKNKILIDELHYHGYKHGYDKNMICEGILHATKHSKERQLKNLQKEDIIFNDDAKDDEKDDAKHDEKDSKKNKNKNRNKTKIRTNSNNNEKKSKKENSAVENSKHEISPSRSSSVRMGFDGIINFRYIEKIAVKMAKQLISSLEHLECDNYNFNYHNNCACNYGKWRIYEKSYSKAKKLFSEIVSINLKYLDRIGDMCTSIAEIPSIIIANQRLYSEYMTVVM